MNSSPSSGRTTCYISQHLLHTLKVYSARDSFSTFTNHCSLFHEYLTVVTHDDELPIGVGRRVLASLSVAGDAVRTTQLAPCFAGVKLARGPHQRSLPAVHDRRLAVGAAISIWRLQLHPQTRLRSQDVLSWAVGVPLLQPCTSRTCISGRLRAHLQERKLLGSSYI